MPKRIIENDEYDFNLSRTTKYIVAITAQLLSWAIWLFFSTPATVEFCKRFSLDMPEVLGLYPGVYMGIFAGVSFSILEMLLTYFWLWKRNSTYWIGIVICMGVSIAATTGFTNIGQQNAEIKYDEIENAGLIVQNLQDKIETEKGHIRSYDVQIDDLRRQGKRIPNWLFARRREAVERMDALTSQTNNAIQNQSRIRSETGAIVTLDPIHSKNKYLNFSNFIAVVLEIFIIVLLIISNAVWKKIDSPSQYASRTKSDSDYKSDLAKLADGGRLRVGRPNGVSPIILSEPSPKASPIGFGRDNNTASGSGDNKEIRVNSVDAICMILDHAASQGQKITNTEVAEMVGVDESWVRKVKKRHRPDL